MFEYEQLKINPFMIVFVCIHYSYWFVRRRKNTHWSQSKRQEDKRAHGEIKWARISSIYLNTVWLDRKTVKWQEGKVHSGIAWAWCIGEVRRDGILGEENKGEESITPSLLLPPFLPLCCFGHSSGEWSDGGDAVGCHGARNDRLSAPCALSSVLQHPSLLSSSWS